MNIVMQKCQLQLQMNFISIEHSCYTGTLSGQPGDRRWASPGPDEPPPTHTHTHTHFMMHRILLEDSKEKLKCFAYMKELYW